MPIEIIQLHAGYAAPSGADWARIARLPDGGCDLVAGFPDRRGIMSSDGIYRNVIEAERAAIDDARRRGCRLLYLEDDTEREGV